MTTQEVFEAICKNTKLISRNDPGHLKIIYEKGEIDFCDHWVIVLRVQAMLKEEVARTRQEDLDAMFKFS